METSASEDEPPGSRGNQSQALKLERFQSHPRPEEVEAHKLCDSCARLISNSRIIQDFLGNAELEDAYTIWKRLRGGQRRDFFSRSHALPPIAAFEAGTACHLCSLVWHRLPLDAVEHGCGYLDVTVAEDRSVDHVPVTFEVAASGSIDKRSATSSGAYGPWNVCILLKKYRGPLYPAGTSGSGLFLPLTSGSEGSFATARFWLNDCLRDHPECRMRSALQAKRRPSKLPTRLIHVGEAQGQLIARLVLPTASASLEDIPYLTLSHSWSITTKEASLKLGTENIQQLQESIPLEALSQTFRDAMDMTRRLGYGYIWIDSLCIIQDSHEDWEKEAVTMCDVYGNSTCTIAALGTGGMDRCYVQRNPLSLFPCRVSTADDRIPVYAISPDWTWDFDKMDKDSPLFQRGWVMQERLLSSRVIFTGHLQFHWECCHYRTNEAFTFAFGSGPITTQSPKLTFHALCDPQYCATGIVGVADLTNMSWDGNMLELYYLWTKHLADYTHMNLSYQSDKLPAIAGVVDAIQASRGWTNMAGVWKEFWLLELLWGIDSDKGKFKPNLTPTASGLPSWSWAATGEPKRFFHPMHLCMGRKDAEIWEDWGPDRNQVIQFDAKRDGDSLLQLFSMAQLVSSCGVPSSSLHSRSTITPTTTLTVKGLVWRGYVNIEPPRTPWAVFTELERPRSYNYRRTKYFWDEEPSINQVVYFLPLITTSGRDRIEKQYGLILIPVPVEDVGNVKYWPPVPWQNEQREWTVNWYKIYTGSGSYWLQDILHPGKDYSREAEPTHYRRIGVFFLRDKIENVDEYVFRNDRKVYERTIHIV